MPGDLYTTSLSTAEQAAREAVPFVTDALVEAVARRLFLRAGWDLGAADKEAAWLSAKRTNKVEFRRCLSDAADLLRFAAPLWLAHVRSASEHTADYQVAEAAAAELRRVAATITPAGPATGETTP